MKFKVIWLSLITVLTLAGCGGGVKPDKLYSEKDYSGLTHCLGLSYSARRVADYKLKGTSISDVKKTISKDTTRKSRKLISELIDVVYTEKFKSSWKYSIGFFKKCSNKVALVSDPRVKHAVFCVFNSYISDAAYSFKVQGKDKEKAYKYFSKFKGKTPNAIIDKVYEKVESRRSARLIPWRGCMKLRTTFQ